MLVINRTGRSLELPDRIIRIRTDNDNIPVGFAEFQIFDMAQMQHIETAVGKDNLLS